MAKPHIIRRSRHHWRSQHHLPKANIIQKSLICQVDKLGFFVGAGGGGRTRTLLPGLDFESSTSANSITPAYLVLAPIMVLVTGLEPVRYCYRGILSPLRLPIPPLELIIKLMGPTGLEPVTLCL